MTRLQQNDWERLMDRVQRGELTVDQANVEKVRMMRVQLVTNRLPASVRRALREAVKRGELAHMRKDGHKPEAFYHPSFEHLAHAERAAYERSVIRALVSASGVFVRPFEDE